MCCKGLEGHTFSLVIVQSAIVVDTNNSAHYMHIFVQTGKNFVQSYLGLSSNCMTLHACILFSTAIWRKSVWLLDLLHAH